MGRGIAYAVAHWMLMSELSWNVKLGRLVAMAQLLHQSPSVSSLP